MSPKSHERNLRNRGLAVLATVAVVTAGAIGSRQVTGGGGGGGGGAPTTANIWVSGLNSPNGTCTRSSTPETYASASAANRQCNPNDDTSDGAWNAAYAIAQSGDRIIVKGDATYTIEQAIQLRTGLTGVTFYMAAGENVIVDEVLLIRTQNLTITGGDVLGVNSTDRLQVDGTQSCPASNCDPDQGLSVGWDNNSPNVHDNLFENIHARNVNFDDDSHDNTFRYGEVGPDNLGSPGFLCQDLVQTGEAEMTFEYSSVHTIQNDCGGAHTDAFDINPPDGIGALNMTIIRGNYVYDCGEQCIFMGDEGNWLVENNMIEETTGSTGQEVGLMGTGTFRFNSMDGDSPGFGRESDRPGDATVYGNIFFGVVETNACDDNSGVVHVAWDNNIWTITPDGGVCGNGKVCTPIIAATGSAWTNADRQANFHLASSDTCAKGYGATASGQPPKDIDEQDRPLNAYDNGADEIP